MRTLIVDYRKQRGEHAPIYINEAVVECVESFQGQTVFIALTVISLIGSFLFFLIQKPEPKSIPSDESESLLQAESSECLCCCSASRSRFPSSVCFQEGIAAVCH